MGQSQSGASNPAGAGEVKNPTGGENAGHRAAYPQEAAGGRSGTPAEAKKEQRFRNGYVIFLFSGTKVVPHAAFVKGRFTLRVKNTLCFADRCLGKKKKMLFFGTVSVLSFCYRDLSAWWENRNDQLCTQYHFVITVMMFYGVTLRYRFLFILVIVQ